MLKKLFQKKDGTPSKLGVLTKPKVGGTFVGNLVRAAANKATGGILGNGVMMKKEGEDQTQYITRQEEQISEQIGAAAAGQQTVVAKQSFQDKIASKGKGFMAKLIGGSVGFILLIIGIIKLANRGKNNSKGRR